MEISETRHESKTKILDAALHVIRAKGYEATRIEDVCEAAGLTKGSFFYHFKSKEDLALAAVDYWGEMTGAFFASAPYHESADPLERLLAYVDFRKAILQGCLPDFTCLVGTDVVTFRYNAPDLGVAQSVAKLIEEHPGEDLLWIGMLQIPG